MARVRITVLGGVGAWPGPGGACSGYLVEQDGFRLLVDPGYATLPRLLELVPAGAVDAVLVTHGHPDHCADLHPLLRARVLAPETPPPLPVHSLPGAVDTVLTLDGPGALDGAYLACVFEAGDEFALGPFQVATRLLPHMVPNAGLRLAAGGRVLAYTGDTGPGPEVVKLAEGADLFLAEATYAEQVPDRWREHLSSGLQAGECASRAGVGRLLLTHLWPGTAAEPVVDAARRAFTGPTAVAAAGMIVEV